tara:strand:- start:174 stop:359 length:186 start_codon:yes stop_codon:yes gene_type:complete
MEIKTITIIVRSDMDDSTILDIANEAGQRIVDEIEAYGEEAMLLDEETCVESSDSLSDSNE